MSQNLKGLYGVKLAALDGDIGHIKDFYFDDKTWIIRYVVAETGSWFTGRKVLLSPYAFGPLSLDAKTLSVNLTQKQIADSPPIESHEPVSRQFEVKYYRHYGWPAYWEGKWTWGTRSYPVLLPVSETKIGGKQHSHDPLDSHLRSTRAVDGYRVESTDGTIGQVDGFTLDRDSWVIHEVIVRTGHQPGDEILISPDRIDEIYLPERKMSVTLTKEEIRQMGTGRVVRAGPEDAAVTEFID
jgi:hypothetical protein